MVQDGAPVDGAHICSGVECLLGVAFGGCGGCADHAQGIAEPLTGADEVRVIEAEGGSERHVFVTEEVFQPRGTKGNVVELPCESLCHFDLEGALVGAPGCPEEGDGCGDEF